MSRRRLLVPVVVVVLGVGGWLVLWERPPTAQCGIEGVYRIEESEGKPRANQSFHIQQRPMKEASIEFTSLETNEVFQGKSDKEGKFRIETKPGRYRCTPKQGKITPQSVIEVVPGQFTRHDLLFLFPAKG